MWFSCPSYSLLVAAGLVWPPILRFAGAGARFAKRLFNGFGCCLTALAVKACGLDRDVTGRRDADMDFAAHSEPPSSVSKIEPSASTLRVARSPRKRASRVVLWTP